MLFKIHFNGKISFPTSSLKCAMSVVALPGGMLGARSRLRPLPLSLAGWCASCYNNNDNDNNHDNDNNNNNNNDNNRRYIVSSVGYRLVDRLPLEAKTPRHFLWKVCCDIE